MREFCERCGVAKAVFRQHPAYSDQLLVRAWEVCEPCGDILAYMTPERIALEAEQEKEMKAIMAAMDPALTHLEKLRDYYLNYWLKGLTL